MIFFFFHGSRNVNVCRSRGNKSALGGNAFRRLIIAVEVEAILLIVPL